jgi:hypothetical protein
MVASYRSAFLKPGNFEPLGPLRIRGRRIGSGAGVAGAFLRVLHGTHPSAVSWRENWAGNVTSNGVSQADAKHFEGEFRMALALAAGRPGRNQDSMPA